MSSITGLASGLLSGSVGGVIGSIVGGAAGGAANPAQALAKGVSESFEGVFSKMKGAKKPGGHECPSRPSCISNHENISNVLTDSKFSIGWLLQPFGNIKYSGGLKEAFKPLDKDVIKERPGVMIGPTPPSWPEVAPMAPEQEVLGGKRMGRNLKEMRAQAEKIYGGNNTENVLKLQDMMQQMQAAIAVISSFMKKQNETAQQMMSHIKA